jgi:hypothetical protein
VQDIRNITADRAGIYSAYLDVLYDRTLVSANFDAGNDLGFEITFSADYANGTSGDINTPGLLNEVGAFQNGFDALGAGKLEIFRVVFTANQVGVVDFLGDPADESPAHNVLYYDPPEVVSLADIRYGFTSLTIVDPNSGTTGGGNPGDPLDVNYDGFISPIDALLVVNHLNRGGAPLSSRLDVNRDRFVSPIDALLVVNYLNRRDGSGEGEGSYSLLDAASGDSSTTAPTSPTSPDLLDAPQWWTALDVMSPAASFDRALLPAGVVRTPAAVDTAANWQLRVGQSAITSETPSVAADVVDEPWESLLDTLAEDVLEAWLDGDNA